MATFVIKGPVIPIDRPKCVVCMMLQKAFFFKQDDGFKERLQNVNDRPSDGTITQIVANRVKDIPFEDSIGEAPNVLGFTSEVCWTHIAGHDPDAYKKAQEEALTKARMNMLNPNAQGIIPN